MVSQLVFDTAEAPRAGCLCPPHAGEVIVGTDGRFLGCFDEIYHPSPFPGDLADPLWPIGFTPVGWLGQQSGENGVSPFVQWLHGTKVSCNGDDPNLSYVPRFVNILIGGGAVTDHIISPNTHVKSPPITTEAAVWPVAGQFAWGYSASELRVVADNSGPPGLTTLSALEVDFSGLGSGEGPVFIGEGGGFLNAGPGGGYGWDHDETSHSTTGWHVDNDSCWTLDFWVKAVPDDNGFVCTGYDLAGSTGFYPDYKGWSSLILDGTWQHYLHNNTWFPSSLADPMNNAVLQIGTTHSNYFDCALDTPDGHHLVLAIKKGRIHIKCLQVYPCEAAVGVHLEKHVGQYT